MENNVQQEQLILPKRITVRDSSGGRYVIEGLLGKGKSGAVYLVRDRRDRQRLFALKEIINPDKRDRERFIFEGEVLKRLDHRALPRVYQVFENDRLKRVYILMDYIQGRDLEALRQDQPEQRFSLPLVMALMAPIVDALSYLHRQDPPIVHRDIKPANIIVPIGADEAMLVDFGSAKEYVAGGPTTILRHSSPGYAALEQYGGGTTPRTDIYGLGATFYSLLTGTIPTDAINRVTAKRNSGIDPLKSVHLLVPTVPTLVAQTIQRALSLSRDDRFETAEQFWQELAVLPIQQPVQLPDVRSEDITQPLAIPVQDMEHNMFTLWQHQRAVLRSRKGRVLLLLFLTFLVTIAVGTGFFSHLWGLTLLFLLCIGLLLSLFLLIT
jgi:serine/threonine protein kinase